MDAPEQPVALAPGSVFHERYEVVRCLKAGGMGAIYEVTHRETRRRRALKVMLPTLVTNADMHARFRLEATVAADIESEHIVETFDAGVDKATGSPFLVMELLRGEDLSGVIEKRGRLRPVEVVQLLAQVASALDKTHAAGVVHRDLKPENLFLARRDDGSPKVKILDFGIAKVVSERGEPAARTKILGTPLYMSPEQIRGDGAISASADLHALAHIAFTLLVGQAYWEEEAAKGQLYALMMRIVAGGQMSASEMAAKYGVALVKEFDVWFARATALEPKDRFASAGEQIELLGETFGIEEVRRSMPDVSAPPLERVVAPPPEPQGPGATRVLVEPAASLREAQPLTATVPLPEAATASRGSNAFREATAKKPMRFTLAIGMVGLGLVVAVAIGARFTLRASAPEITVTTAIAEPKTAAPSARAPEPTVAPSPQESVPPPPPEPADSSAAAEPPDAPSGSAAMAHHTRSKPLPPKPPDLSVPAATLPTRSIN